MVRSILPIWCERSDGYDVPKMVLKDSEGVVTIYRHMFWQLAFTCSKYFLHASCLIFSICDNLRNSLCACYTGYDTYSSGIVGKIQNTGIAYLKQRQYHLME